MKKLGYLSSAVLIVILVMAGSFPFLVFAQENQPPVLVNNTGITVEEGGTAIITSSELMATDDRSVGNEITFYITRLTTLFDRRL